MKKYFKFLIVLVGVMVGAIMLGNFCNVFAEDVALEYISESVPDFYIKAVNPGYTIDGVQNVGEMIEIGRKDSDAMDSLAGFKIDYTNSSGNTVLIADLSKYIWQTGETILLRLASSPQSELAHENYSKTLALKAGPLRLLYNDEVIDSVCWTSKDDCVAAFDSKKPTTLLRNLEDGSFLHVDYYEPIFELNNLKIFEEDDENDLLQEKNEEHNTQCKNIIFSEILSYYESLQSEQFIELFNNSAENVRADGCFLKYKNKLYPLVGMIQPDGYLLRELYDFKLTKNPTTSNVLELVDTAGEVVDKLEYFNGQVKGTAFAMIGYDEMGVEIWKTTFLPTPGEPNIFQEFRTCEEGKVINEETGNCVKATTVAEKVCGEGQYLNLLTGRCKKIPETTADTKECKEGYYYNEETGRCRKIKENTGAEYAVVPETYEENSSFVALYLVLGVLGVGIVYIIYEFRHDIMKTLRRILGRR